MFETRNIILASASPRRQQILKDAGVNFNIKVREVRENFPEDMAPAEVPLFLAKLKAAQFNDLQTSDVVITADTVVVLESSVLNKPENFEEAFNMLSRLSGKTHQVITGVNIKSASKEVSFSDLSEVTFRELTPKEIEFYINECKPYDKAGGYGIQDWIGLVGITSIKGSFFNVMGLPIHRLYLELKAFC